MNKTNAIGYDCQRREVIFGLLLLFSLLFTACDEVKSNKLDPSELNLSTDLIYINDPNVKNKMVTCSSSPSQEKESGGFATSVELVDGDSLTCNGVKMNLVKNQIVGYTYVASVPKTTDNIYNITFYSKGEKYSSASVEMMALFDIESPRENFTLKFDEKLNVSLKAKYYNLTETKVEIRSFKGRKLEAKVEGENDILLPSFLDRSPNTIKPVVDENITLYVTRSKVEFHNGSFKGTIRSVVEKSIHGTLLKPL